MTGRTYARLTRRRSIQLRLSGSSPTGRFLTSVGVIFQTSTEGSGTTTRLRRCPAILNWVIYRLSALAGEVAARSATGAPSASFTEIDDDLSRTSRSTSRLTAIDGLVIMKLVRLGLCKPDSSTLGCIRRRDRDGQASDGWMVRITETTVHFNSRTFHNAKRKVPGGTAGF